MAKVKTQKTSQPVILVISTIFLIILLVSQLLPKDAFQKAREKVLRNSQDNQSHLVLAEQFLKTNQIKETQKELLLVEKLNKEAPNSKILGTDSQFQEIFNSWQQQDPEEIKKLIKQWQKVVKETPSYRDAWLYLAFYSYKLDQKEEASSYLKKALEIDPFYSPSQELEEILNK